MKESGRILFRCTIPIPIQIVTEEKREPNFYTGTLQALHRQLDSPDGVWFQAKGVGLVKTKGEGQLGDLSAEEVQSLFKTAGGAPKTVLVLKW